MITWLEDGLSEIQITSSLLSNQSPLVNVPHLRNTVLDNPLATHNGRYDHCCFTERNGSLERRNNIWERWEGQMGIQSVVYLGAKQKSVHKCVVSHRAYSPLDLKKLGICFQVESEPILKMDDEYIPFNFQLHHCISYR